MSCIESSSIHVINADNPLSHQKKFLWFLLNYLNNNIFPQLAEPKLRQQNFACDLQDFSLNNELLKSSPSRVLSNLFWKHLPWRKIKEDLKEIHVLDVGCGRGKYSKAIREYSNKQVLSYTGLDIVSYPEWAELQQKSPNDHFVVMKDPNEVLSLIPKDTNLIITQSAIEHFQADLPFFNQIRQFVTESNRKLIQIHLFPSKECYYTYPLHGVRQYTPRTVSLITKKFNSFSTCVLFNLGGGLCNDLHLEFIARPIQEGRGDLRDIMPETYDQKLRAAIHADMNLPTKNSAFYALFIHSYPGVELFSNSQDNFTNGKEN